jgi:hypothetical protein
MKRFSEGFAAGLLLGFAAGALVFSKSGGRTKTKLSDAYLIDYSGKHLLHELNMFWQLAGKVQKLERSFMLSALLESFAIHLRNLIGFFYGSRYLTDVIAANFFDDPRAWSPTMSRTLREARKRVNKEVGHLTQGRKSGDTPDWNAAGLFNEIEAVAKDFAVKASSKKLHPKVLDLLKLSGEEAMLWLQTNATYSNAAVQTVSFRSTPNFPAKP